MAHIYLLHGGMSFLEMEIEIDSLGQLWLPLKGHGCDLKLGDREDCLYYSAVASGWYCCSIEPRQKRERFSYDSGPIA